MLVRPGERKERSLALFCTASITARARARERLRALYGEEEDHHRGRRACAAHNTPTSEGREGHDTNSSWRGRERGVYKPRAVAEAWAMLLGCRRNGGEDDDAQML